jgi:hypothetical protein
MVTKPYKLKIEPMTEKTFGPYGVLIDAKERPKDHRTFTPIDFQLDGQTTLNVIWQPQQGIRSWHSLDRYLLAPPGGSFLMLNTAPNPTQIVDYQESISVTYPDLATEANPVAVALTRPYGITFELTL